MLSTHLRARSSQLLSEAIARRLQLGCLQMHLLKNAVLHGCWHQTQGKQRQDMQHGISWHAMPHSNQIEGYAINKSHLRLGCSQLGARCAPPRHHFSRLQGQQRSLRQAA